MTDGSFIVADGLRMTCSYSATTTWDPFTTALTASSQWKMDSGKYAHRRHHPGKRAADRVSGAISAAVDGKANADAA
jgi:hypothetical protein